MIDNRWMDKRLKEVLMIDELSIVETDKVNHTVETDMVKLVIEIECFGMSFDEFDKETGSSDGMQPKQADLSCVHALNEPHLHEIHVVPSKHEADQYEEPKVDELSQEQLQQLMIIVPEEGMNVEALQTKYPIIDWEVYSEDTIKFWKIIRVGNYIEVYQVFEDMLKNFDRDDLVKLWSLVHERFNSTELTDDKAKELWVELKRLFEPDENDTLWKIQRYMHDPLTWKLYDTCGVHHVSIERGYDIFMLRKIIH
ncbi:hypothetical protein Tco_1025616 [Tanacetum coccineum]